MTGVLIGEGIFYLCSRKIVNWKIICEDNERREAFQKDNLVKTKNIDIIHFNLI